MSEIFEVEFHNPLRVCESERITTKKTRDAAIQLVENNQVDTDADILKLYDAASVFSKSISKCESWVFTGSLEGITEEHLPKELYRLFRWVVQGQSNVLSTDKKSSEIYKRAMSLAQSTVSPYLSDRQVRNKISELLRSTLEMPQQLAVGLAIHQACLGKKIISLLHGFGNAPDYNKILRVETQIERSVLRRILDNDGVYLPLDIVKGRHVFFAVDNVDFAADTVNGKHILHKTAMEIYQKRQSEDKEPYLVVDEPTHIRSVKEPPHSVTELLDCPKPAFKPRCSTYPSFKVSNNGELPLHVTLPDSVWLLGWTLLQGNRRGTFTYTHDTHRS